MKQLKELLETPEPPPKMCNVLTKRGLGLLRHRRLAVCAKVLEVPYRHAPSGGAEPEQDSVGVYVRHHLRGRRDGRDCGRINEMKVAWMQVSRMTPTSVIVSPALSTVTTAFP
jgi:hypothetical protein